MESVFHLTTKCSDTICRTDGEIKLVGNSVLRILEQNRVTILISPFCLLLKACCAADIQSVIKQKE